MASKLIIHDVEQGTPEWFLARDLKMTASEAKTIATGGKGLMTYCRRLVLEHILPNNRQTLTTPDMDRGHLLEPEARKWYSSVMDREVRTVGFIEKDKYTGCSPDGLIGEDGGLEIKSPSDKTFLDYVVDGGYNPDYYWQCQMSMLVTGRKWWDLVLYNPNYKQVAIIERIKADKKAFADLKQGLAKGKKEIERLLKIVKTN
jgi:hypothetical protein